MANRSLERTWSGFSSGTPPVLADRSQTVEALVWTGALPRTHSAAAKAGVHGTALGKGQPSDPAQSGDRTGSLYPRLGQLRPGSWYCERSDSRVKDQPPRIRGLLGRASVRAETGTGLGDRDFVLHISE
jgi:hypothetical protein